MVLVSVNPLNIKVGFDVKLLNIKVGLRRFFMAAKFNVWHVLSYTNYKYINEK
jgi:hypothetical protein